MKKLLSGILSLAVLLTALLVPVAATETEVIQVGDQKMTFAAFVADYAKYAASDVTLLADVDATALTESLAAFSGTLNGNGKTVSNLSVPLFAALNGATVKDLTLQGSIGTAEASLKSGTDIGALTCVTTGEVTLSNLVNNVDVYVRLSADLKGIAGFIGEITDGAVKITSCVQNGVICSVNVLDSTANERPYCAGFVGVMEGGSLTVIASLNNGDIMSEALKLSSGKYSAMLCVNAGFLGRTNSTASASFVKCANYGTMGRPEESPNLQARCENYKNGGFVGSARGKNGLSFELCVNFGSVKGGTATSSVGIGCFIGELKDTVVMKSCYNMGQITENAGHFAGGFVGDFNSSGNSTITGCVNMGTLVSQRADATGTFIGKLTAGSVNLDACVNVGNADMKSVGMNTATSDHTVSYADPAAWSEAVAEQNQVFVQTSAVENGKYSARLISTLSSVEGYANAGFEIIRIGGGEAPASVGGLNVTIKTVYESLIGTNAEGKTLTYTPADLTNTAKYFSAAVINNIPADQNVMLIVRPYLVKADTAEVVWGVASMLAFQNGNLLQP